MRPASRDVQVPVGADVVFAQNNRSVILSLFCTRADDGESRGRMARGGVFEVTVVGGGGLAVLEIQAAGAVSNWRPLHQSLERPPKKRCTVLHLLARCRCLTAGPRLAQVPASFSLLIGASRLVASWRRTTLALAASAALGVTGLQAGRMDILRRILQGQSLANCVVLVL